MCSGRLAGSRRRGRRPPASGVRALMTPRSTRALRARCAAGRAGSAGAPSTPDAWRGRPSAPRCRGGRRAARRRAASGWRSALRPRASSSAGPRFARERAHVVERDRLASDRPAVARVLLHQAPGRPPHALAGGGEHGIREALGELLLLRAGEDPLDELDVDEEHRLLLVMRSGLLASSRQRRVCTSGTPPDITPDNLGRYDPGGDGPARKSPVGGAARARRRARAVTRG